MGTIYLAALILGMGTLVLQFVLSHAGGGDTGDAEVGGEVDDLALEAEAGGELDHDVDGADGHHGSLVGSTAGLFLSMRFWTFALMAFGMVGALLHWLNLAGFGVTLTLSIVTGLISGLVAGVTFRMLKGSVSSSTSQDDTVGKMGQVTVPLRKGSLGKVRVLVKGKRVDMLATTDAESIDMGDDVVVVEFRGEHAYVEPIGKSEPPAR